LGSVVTSVSTMMYINTPSSSSSACVTWATSFFFPPQSLAQWLVLP
jgi:hypothetical protein